MSILCEKHWRSRLTRMKPASAGVVLVPNDFPLCKNCKRQTSLLRLLGCIPSVSSVVPDATYQHCIHTNKLAQSASETMFSSLNSVSDSLNQNGYGWLNIQAWISSKDVECLTRSLLEDTDTDKDLTLRLISSRMSPPRVFAHSHNNKRYLDRRNVGSPRIPDVVGAGPRIEK